MLAGLASRTVMDNVAIVVSAQKMPSIRHLFASFSSVFCRDPDLFSQKTRKPCGQAFRLKPRPLGLSRSCRLCKLFKTCLIYRCTRSLEPTYVKQMPRTDGWGNEFQFTTSEFDEKGHAQRFAIRALGSDGEADRIASLDSGATTSFADDIIYADGSFVRYPESAG